jgi:elongation factor 3
MNPQTTLDRDGLGALVSALKDYKGGVLIICHNKEFCDGVATEMDHEIRLFAH